jgi:hypothetical protein
MHISRGIGSSGIQLPLRRLIHRSVRGFAVGLWASLISLTAMGQEAPARGHVWIISGETK